MKTNTSLRFLTGMMLAGVLCLCGCATDSRVVTLATVGPGPQDVRSAVAGEGCLKVYSATNEFSDGAAMYYPHSRYSIHRGDGTYYKGVDNHRSQNDESPEVVSLPAGTYYVMARSDLDGMVRVPVVIKGGKVTVLNLEGKP